MFNLAAHIISRIASPHTERGKARPVIMPLHKNIFLNQSRPRCSPNPRAASRDYSRDAALKKANPHKEKLHDIIPLELTAACPGKLALT
jgi:hypothetical protein